MIRKKNPNYLQKLSKVVELRTSNSMRNSESVSSVDLLLNQEAKQLGEYKRFDLDNEWNAFKGMISK